MDKLSDNVNIVYFLRCLKISIEVLRDNTVYTIMRMFYQRELFALAVTVYIYT